MSLHFQVFAEFKFIKSKPQLVSTSIFSTSAACTTIPISENSVLKLFRILPTLREAKIYIAYLHRVYPNSPATPPVAYLRYEDSGQKEFFTEVKK